MYTDADHVTHVTVQTVCYNGTAHCEMCGQQIDYRINVHPVPTHCKTCVEWNCRNTIGGTFDRAGDGWRERPAQPAA